MGERTHDYGAKNVVRAEWMRFLPAPFSNPETVHGLYLAGHENLELEHYLRMGIAPDNLVIPEHDTRLLPLVRRRSGGVRVVHGRVIDAVQAIVSERRPRLLFANLDFDGSFGTYRDDLLSVFTVFPTEEEGYLGVTSYCARDDETIGQGIVDLSKFYSGLGDREMYLRDIGSMIARHRHLRHYQSEMTSPDHAHIARTMSFLWWVAVGMGLVDSGQNGYGTFDRAYLDGPVNAVLARIDARARELSDRPSDFHLVYEAELASVLATRNSALWPTDFRHIAYQTQGSQPMRTWFLRIEPVLDAAARPTLQDVLRQLWKLAVRAPLEFIDEGGTLISIGVRS